MNVPLALGHQLIVEWNWKSGSGWVIGTGSGSGSVFSSRREVRAPVRVMGVGRARRCAPLFGSRMSDFGRSLTLICGRRMSAKSQKQTYGKGGTNGCLGAESGQSRLYQGPSSRFRRVSLFYGAKSELLAVKFRLFGISRGTQY